MLLRILGLSCGVLTLCTCSRVSPLIAAARAGRVDEIRTLARAGADPNERGGVNGWTPLMHAIHKQQSGSVRALLEAGADVNAFGGEVNPLLMAAGYGDTALVEILLDHGANPRVATREGVTALAAAVNGVPDIDNFTVGLCQSSTVKLLLDRDPGLRLSADTWSKFTGTLSNVSGCGDVRQMLAARR